MRGEIDMNVAICEDQYKWIEVLETYLTEFRKTHRNIQWEAFGSAEELLLHSEKNNYTFDILITDIEMKKINGIELAKKVREKDSGTVIFFLTSHDEYIRQCFQPAPLNFWDKPLSYEQFKDDMEKAVRIVKTNDKVFIFKEKDGYRRLPFKYIVYFHTSGKKIIAHTKEADYEFYGSFKNFANIWQTAGFIRANRFYYINTQFIEKIKTTEVIFNNGDSIQIAPANMKNIKMMLFENDCNIMERMGDEK